jgi:hypothetical protein
MSITVGQPKTQAQPQAVPESQLQPAGAPKPKPSVAAPLAIARPKDIAISIPRPASAPSPGYDEWLAKLEPLIQSQLAEVQAVMNEKKLTPADVSMVYGIDITGRETSVCLACGIEGHDFQPTKVRKENPAIDMLQESLIVFQEVAARAGIRYGLMAYDDKGVFKLKDVGGAGTTGDRGLIAERFLGFRKRFVTPDITDPKWIAQEKARWVPSDANRKMAGEPDDTAAINVLSQMLKGSAGPMGAVVTKSHVPKTSLRTQSLIAKSSGVMLQGIAVGERRAEVAKSMFDKTNQAVNMHALKGEIGKAITGVIAQLK